MLTDKMRIPGESPSSSKWDCGREMPIVMVAGEEGRKLRGTRGKEVVPGASGLPFLWCPGVEKLRHKRCSQKSLQDSYFPRGMSDKDVADN